MKLQMQTALGHTVEWTSALVATVSNAPGGVAGSDEICAVMHIADDDVMAKIEEVDALRTRCGLIITDEAAFGIVTVLVGSAVLMSVLDLAQAEARRMLQAPPPNGFAFALVGNKAQKLLRIPVPLATRQLVDRRRSNECASLDLKSQFLAFLVGHFDTAEGLRRIGLEGIAADRVMLAIAEPTTADLEADHTDSLQAGVALH